MKRQKDRIPEYESSGQESDMLLGKRAKQLLIAPERMKCLGQIRNDAQLWMFLVVKVKSYAVKNNIASERGMLGPWIKVKWSSRKFLVGFLSGSVVKHPPIMQGTQETHRFEPWVRKIPWRRKWQPTKYSYLENPMNIMKKQKDRTLKDELTRSVGAWYVIREEQRNSSRKNEAKAKTTSSGGCDWWWN